MTKFILENAPQTKWARYRPSVAQSVGRSIALLFLDHDTRRGWVVSSTPRPHFTPGKDPVPFFSIAKAVAFNWTKRSHSKASKYGRCFAAITYCALSDILLSFCLSAHFYGTDQIIIFQFWWPLLKAMSVNISWGVTFSRWGVVSTSPNPQAGGPPLVGCPFLDPQPEDTPFRGDREPTYHMGQVEVTCECGNEPSGSIKCGEFLD